MICQYCKMRYAEYSTEDYILDLPSPPGRGIIAKSDDAWQRRMQMYWSDKLGDCGCNEQEVEFR